jgi:hypothetical protein
VQHFVKKNAWAAVHGTVFDKIGLRARLLDANEKAKYELSKPSITIYVPNSSGETEPVQILSIAEQILEEEEIEPVKELMLALDQDFRLN